jgi:hypothetical protein
VWLVARREAATVADVIRWQLVKGLVKGLVPQR